MNSRLQAQDDEQGLVEGHLGARGRVPVRVGSGLLHRQEHDPHRRHEGGPQVRRLLHPANSQVRGTAPHSESNEDVEECQDVDV